MTDAEAVAKIGQAAMCLVSDGLPREYVEAVMRGRDALRVKGQLVEALLAADAAIRVQVNRGSLEVGTLRALDKVGAALKAAKEAPWAQG